VDFCNRDFGFFDVASLLVCLNPYSRHDAARERLMRGARDESMLNADGLSGEARTDFVHRVSTYFHERKHFHDLLLTPYGNRIIREQFEYVVICASLFMRRRWKRGDRLELPLRPPAIDPADYELLVRYRNLAHATIEHARAACELSAMLAQVQAIWMWSDEETTYAAMEEWRNVPLYGEMVSHLFDWPEEIGDLHDELSRAMHRIVLALGLGKSNSNDDSLGTLADVFRRLRSIIDANPREGTRLAVRASHEGWKAMIPNFKSAQDSNAKFAAKVRERLQPWPQVVRELVIELVDEFSVQAAALQKLVSDDPDAYVHLSRYVTERKLTMPRMLFFSVEDDLAVFDEPLDVDHYPLAAQNVHDLEDGQRKYSYRLVPATPPNAATMSERWEVYARDLCAFTALFEPVDWNHPLKKLALNNLEKAGGVTFVRRFA